MTLKVVFDPVAWSNYLDFQTKDRKTLRKINNLIKDAQRNPTNGLSKPERLVGDLSGCWFRRISDKDRLIYRVLDDELEIVQCKGHYSDS